MRLIDELNALHASYVEAINLAVESNDIDAAERLALGYDEEAIQLIAEREGKTHLLPLQRRSTAPETSLHRLARRLRMTRAA